MGRMQPPTEPDGRLLAFGTQLTEVHLRLREELDRLRADTDRFLDGRAGRPRTLHAHCLAFCAALNRHHTGEDGVAFPALAERFPELRPVLEQLQRDHRLVDEILHQLEELLGGPGTQPGPAEGRRVRGELDGLHALLESHFTYEERRLVAALNSLGIPEWDGATPDFLLTGDAARSRADDGAPP